jgi:uncharacterized protein YbcC (UPF0753/DUF2309 family)
MMIDGVELGSIYACVIDFADNFETSAILGFNFIREFKTTIDIMRSEASVKITLEPKFDISDIHKGDKFRKLQSRFGLAYLQNEIIINMKNKKIKRTVEGSLFFVLLKLYWKSKKV